ncbi:MAG: class I SAM-dependent methyltransferase [Acidimicrobiales bacterium]
MQRTGGTGVADPDGGAPSLAMESVACCLCGGRQAEPVGIGEDFEYRVSDQTFVAVRCSQCSLVYLDPRPALSELAAIYPDTYHAFDFNEDGFGLVHRVRSRLEAHRLLRVGGDLPAGARVLDVGCGDGFHLDLLRRFGEPGWELIGLDTDQRAAAAARRRGLEVHECTVEDPPIEPASVDLALCIQTIEHVDDPVAVLRAIARLLRPGGRLYLITDNTGSPDFALTRGRHWGGYHFPRHWNLFDQRSMRLLAERAGLEIEHLGTTASPVNWTYSVRNWLDDWGAPRRLVECFSLRTAPSLAAFTVLDSMLTALGRGALLRVVLRRPR